MSPNDYFCFDAEDEHLHIPGPEPAWNESLAFCAIEPGGPALFVRHGRRYNEGHIEVTVAQLNPGGSLDVAFAKRPIDVASIGDGTSSSAAGLTFSLIEPLKRWHVGYAGKIRHISDHRHFAADPGAALKAATVSEGAFDLVFEDQGPLFAPGPNGTIPGGDKFLSGRHYESSIRCRGEVALGGARRTLNTQGFRDHSWGVRDMTRVLFHRWLWVQVDETTSCMGWFTGTESEDFCSGIIIRDGVGEVATSAALSSRYAQDTEQYVQECHLVLGSDKGVIDLVLETGAVLPLRYQKEGRTSRILEFASRVKGSGMPAWAEYSDILVDGVPGGNRRA